MHVVSAEMQKQKRRRQTQDPHAHIRARHTGGGAVCETRMPQRDDASRRSLERMLAATEHALLLLRCRRVALVAELAATSRLQSQSVKHDGDGNEHETVVHHHRGVSAAAAAAPPASPAARDCSSKVLGAFPLPAARGAWLERRSGAALEHLSAVVAALADASGRPRRRFFASNPASASCSSSVAGVVSSRRVFDDAGMIDSWAVASRIAAQVPPLPLSQRTATATVESSRHATAEEPPLPAAHNSWAPLDALLAVHAALFEHSLCADEAAGRGANDRTRDATPATPFTALSLARATSAAPLAPTWAFLSRARLSAGARVVLSQLLHCTGDALTTRAHGGAHHDCGQFTQAHWLGQRLLRVCAVCVDACRVLSAMLSKPAPMFARCLMRPAEGQCPDQHRRDALEPALALLSVNPVAVAVRDQRKEQKQQRRIDARMMMSGPFRNMAIGTGALARPTMSQQPSASLMGVARRHYHDDTRATSTASPSWPFWRDVATRTNGAALTVRIPVVVFVSPSLRLRQQQVDRTDGDSVSDRARRLMMARADGDGAADADDLFTMHRMQVELGSGVARRNSSTGSCGWRVPTLPAPDAATRRSSCITAHDTQEDPLVALMGALALASGASGDFSSASHTSVGDVNNDDDDDVGGFSFLWTGPDCAAVVATVAALFCRQMAVV